MVTPLDFKTAVKCAFDTENSLYKSNDFSAFIQFSVFLFYLNILPNRFNTSSCKEVIDLSGHLNIEYSLPTERVEQYKS